MDTNKEEGEAISFLPFVRSTLMNIYMNMEIK